MRKTVKVKRVIEEEIDIESLQKEFELACEGYKKLHGLRDARNDAMEKAIEEFRKKSTAMEKVAEQYGIPYGDGYGHYGPSNEWAGSAMYIPSSFRKFAPLCTTPESKQKLMDIIEKSDEGLDSCEWYLDDEPPFGDWVGSAC
jgi:hypothetical protein